MLSRLLLAGTLTVALGQAAPAPFDWGSVAGGAVSGIPVAGVLLWQLHQRERKLDERDVEIRDLHRQNRDMTERIAVVLEQAVTAMTDVRDGMEATLGGDRPSIER